MLRIISYAQALDLMNVYGIGHSTCNAIFREIIEDSTTKQRANNQCQKVLFRSQEGVWYFCTSRFAPIGYGSVGDRRLCSCCSMSEAMKGLAGSGYYLVGNAAYGCEETMLTPYQGTNLEPYQNSFNFHLSQIRITIERAFGVFVRRFGILFLLTCKALRTNRYSSSLSSYSSNVGLAL
eukprot:Awhi_evm1s13215